MLERPGLLPPVLALALVLAGGSLAAQTMSSTDTMPIRVRGEISGVEAGRVTVQNRDGGVTELKLAPDAKVFTLTPTDAKSVATEAFIGAAGASEQKERIKAAVVVVYPQGATGESSDYLTWDLTPDSTMRNGVVRSVESGPDGQVVALSYPQGGSTVVIPPEATVMALAQADHNLLRKGAQIFVPSAEKGSDGSLEADMVAVGTDGFKPPL
ncbi:hypothetical protein [Skermanella pratensis]|uniref:hypothetical protein n=1 Tax=Skermanella pratensis TaxID=2233999 RepID=UPI001300FD90|nr:hypothetical protein [Skermanella pratensis]